jgi:hypothetical protein
MLLCEPTGSRVGRWLPRGGQATPAVAVAVAHLEHAAASFCHLEPPSVALESPPWRWRTLRGGSRDSLRAPNFPPCCETCCGGQAFEHGPNSRADPAKAFWAWHTFTWATCTPSPASRKRLTYCHYSQSSGGRSLKEGSLLSTHIHWPVTRFCELNQHNHKSRTLHGATSMTTTRWREPPWRAPLRAH